jgi:hypothetical protein
MQIELIDVDLFNSGQLDEFFLTNINPNGQAGASVMQMHVWRVK